MLLWRQGDYGKAMALYEESLALARDLGDQKGGAQALLGLALVTMQQGGTLIWQRPCLRKAWNYPGNWRTSGEWP